MRVPRALLLVPFLTACCFADPPHEAVVELEFDVPAAALESVSCTTHNGTIRMSGVETDRAVVHARLSARGWSPEEAEANVRRIRLRHEVENESLSIWWEPESEDWEWDDSSPDVSFVIEVPGRLASRLTTHNGEVEVRGIEGSLAVTTHNGEVALTGAFPRLDVQTHNGGIEADLAGSGPVEGSLGTHNGEVTVNMGGRSARVLARTHNGGISVRRGAGIAWADGGELSVSVGDGGGELRIVTHNGEVVVR